MLSTHTTKKQKQENPTPKIYAVDWKIKNYAMRYDSVLESRNLESGMDCNILFPKTNSHVKMFLLFSNTGHFSALHNNINIIKQDIWKKVKFSIYALDWPVKSQPLRLTLAAFYFKSLKYGKPFSSKHCPNKNNIFKFRVQIFIDKKYKNFTCFFECVDSKFWIDNKMMWKLFIFSMKQ